MLSIICHCVALCLVVQLYPTLCDPTDCSPPGSSVHGDSPGKNTGVGRHALLQEIFPTQASNPGLLHCRWMLYCLSHQGSPGIPEWVAYPFSMGSFQPRNWTGVSCIAGWFFTGWAAREASHMSLKKCKLKLWDTTTHLLENSRSKALITPNAGKGMEQQELSLTADANEMKSK